MIRKRNRLEQGIFTAKQGLEEDTQLVRNTSQTISKNDEHIIALFEEISRLSTMG